MDRKTSKRIEKGGEGKDAGKVRDRINPSESNFDGKIALRRDCLLRAEIYIALAELRPALFWPPRRP